MNTALTIFDPQLQDFLHPHFTVETLDNSCSFSEGPVWNADSYYLFSDIPENKIYKIVPGKEKEVLINTSGGTLPDLSLLSKQTGSNGLAYNETELLVCQHGSGAVAQWNGRDLLPFITGFEGRRFNSPNDIIVHKSGRIFFSDPPYGLKDQEINASLAQPLAGVYGWYDGEVNLFCTEFNYPNGVCLSPDQTRLYCCSNKPAEKKLLEYDAETLMLNRVLCEENADGIKCDRHGNLYLCNKAGLLILNQEGKRLGLIALPAIPANCCWGGEELSDLLITARENIFFIRGLVR